MSAFASRPDLRGKCEEYARAAVAEDPTLTLVRGWYDDPFDGPQEHWWTTRADGTIHDPTAGQFSPGGEYREFTGTYPCMNCGRECPEWQIQSHGGTCCGPCYGQMVGIYDEGRCTCGTETA